jgi:hypothetical protein
VASLAGAPADDLNRVLGSLEQKAASLPPGSDGLVALDHFQGNRTPLKDAKSRGAIWGLTLWHSMPHLFRAFLEANAFGTRHILDNLKDHGYGSNVFAGRRCSLRPPAFSRMSAAWISNWSGRRPLWARLFGRVGAVLRCLGSSKMVKLGRSFALQNKRSGDF